MNTNNLCIKYFKKPIDITAIKISNSLENYEFIEFLDYDLNYNLKGYIIYNDVKIFSIHYPLGEDAVCAKGKITNIIEFEFCHNILTDPGSSGCPNIIKT